MPSPFAFGRRPGAGDQPTQLHPARPRCCKCAEVMVVSGHQAEPPADAHQSTGRAQVRLGARMGAGLNEEVADVDGLQHAWTP